jgi:hypothetical protein
MNKLIAKSYRSLGSLSGGGGGGKRLTRKNRRRLSFVGFVEQRFDHTAPACETVQHDIHPKGNGHTHTPSPEEYESHPKKNTRFASSSGNAATITTTPLHHHHTPKTSRKRLKSALKFFPRFGRPRRRASWLACGDNNNNSSEGDKSGDTGVPFAPPLPKRSFFDNDDNDDDDDDDSKKGKAKGQDSIFLPPTHRVLAENYRDIRWGDGVGGGGGKGTTTRAQEKNAVAPPSMPRYYPPPQRRSSLVLGMEKSGTTGTSTTNTIEYANRMGRRHSTL